MTEIDLIHRAQEGDAEAIAALMNASLQEIGASAKASIEAGCLHVLLEADKPLDPDACIEFVSKGIEQLKVRHLAAFVIYGRITGHSRPDWIEEVELTASPSFWGEVSASQTISDQVAEPFSVNSQVASGRANSRSMYTVLSTTSPPLAPPPPLPEGGLTGDFKILPPESVQGSAPELHGPLNPAPAVETANPPMVATSRRRSLRKPRCHLARGVLLLFPLLLALGVIHIWNRYLMASDSAVNRSGNPGSTDALGDSFGAAREQALQAVDLGRTAKTKAAWQQAADRWQQAIALLQNIPEDHPQRAAAQQKIAEYEGQLRLIQSKWLTDLKLVEVFTGEYAPLSIAYDGRERFLIANGQNKRSLSAIHRNFDLLGHFSDQVRLANYGVAAGGLQPLAPVQVAIAQNGTIWVSHQSAPANPKLPLDQAQCRPGDRQPAGFLQRLRGDRLQINGVVQVGAVPRAIALTPDNRYVLASNWCSWDLSIVNPKTLREIRRLQLGAYPAGIAVDARSQKAYVAISGADRIAVIHLQTFAVSWLESVGRSPTHLALSPDGKWLYATLKTDGQLTKINLSQPSLAQRVATGAEPQSFALSADGRFAYVANFGADSLSKVQTDNLQLLETIAVPPAPVDVAYDPKTNRLWVASTSGRIAVLQDTSYSSTN